MATAIADLELRVDDGICLGMEPTLWILDIGTDIRSGSSHAALKRFPGDGKCLMQ